MRTFRGDLIGAILRRLRVEISSLVGAQSVGALHRFQLVHLNSCFLLEFFR